MLQYLDLPQMAIAFKKQVKCDFEFLKSILKDMNVNPSHRAHLLQMCIEKFAKYYQLKTGFQINKQHNWAEKVIPALFEEKYRNVYSNKIMYKRLKDVHSICREIDLLAPAHYGLAKQNPVNCEYPWEIADINGNNPRAFAPCDYSFSVFNEKHQPIIKKILVIVEEQIK
jgi:hypothetical protein